MGLALRDLAGTPASLLAAAHALEERADPHNALQAWLTEHHDDVEVEVHTGGQPLYPYLFGVE